jgi:YHS domain-containing protein
MFTRLMLAGFVAAMATASGWLMADDKTATKEKLVVALCPVSGDPISKDASIDYKGGKLYFCCKDCVKSFNSDQAKYAAKANLQLVATGQAEQIACPLSGRPTKAGTDLTVAGTIVKFCCNGCKGKVSKADEAAQVKLVYGKGFDKGFKVKSN